MTDRPATVATDGSAGTHKGIAVDLDELIGLRHEAKHLDLVPRGRVLATRSGGHLSPFRGRGMEFDESRVYQPGDEPRNMDWRVTARSGTPHVKLFREERERPVWLVVDQGPGMRFGTRVAFKSVVAAQAAALLGWAASDNGDRVGGMVFDGHRAVQHRPAAGKRGLLPLLRALAGPRPDDTVGDALFVDALAMQLAPSIRSGSLVFLVSDFHGLDAQHLTWMARLARTNELVLVHVYDRLEAEAPPPDRYTVVDGGRRATIDTSSPSLRSSWSGRFARHRDNLLQLSQRYRAHLVELRTDEPVADTLRNGLRPRRHAGARNR
ncbi:MAG: DUF58 domain-containing protein [Gammaproteobacteria bacterium]|nr:DUF58 domain-containing protein [Gammaproteobacteria bacterium]